jgi:hypothetical protein
MTIHLPLVVVERSNRGFDPFPDEGRVQNRVVVGMRLLIKRLKQHGDYCQFFAWIF